MRSWKNKAPADKDKKPFVYAWYSPAFADQDSKTHFPPLMDAPSGLASFLFSLPLEELQHYEDTSHSINLQSLLPQWSQTEVEWFPVSR